MFLSFANAQKDHLPLLREERQSIIKLLEPLEEKGYFKVLHEPEVTRDILSNFLTDYQSRIVLFHYGGHADTDRLAATDGPAFTEGLAALLGKMPNLRLVFLNGCSTQGQVEQLLDAGVQAVIGTSVPVSDNLAVKFSVEFYDALSSGKSVAEAFLDARGKSLLNNNKVQFPERGIRRKDIATTQVAWGLFESDQGEPAQWKLPTETAPPPIPVQLGDINEVLRQNMFHMLAPYDSSLGGSLEKEKKGEPEEQRVIQQQIIDALPVPLGEEVRRIFANEEYSVDRVISIVRTYRCLLQLLTFSLIAQLWDLLFAKPDHPLDAALKETLRHFLITDDDVRTFEEYVGVIRGLRLHFTAAGVNLFIDELSELSNRFNTQPETQAAHKDLERLRQQLKNNPDIVEGDIVSSNKAAETNLGVMFQELGIVCRYKFVTIKDIDLIKKRHRDPEFRIITVSLDRLSAGFRDDPFPSVGIFTENRTVILLKSARKFDKYLNLSPFLIDESALIEQKLKSRLFMFSSYEEASGKINYHHVLDNSAHTQLNAAIYPMVQSEFMAFKQAVLG